MQFSTDARVTFEQIDIIRKDRNTDHLTRFISTLPVFLLAISILFFYFSWLLLDANGVTLLNIFTQPIYQNGVDGKRTSIFLFILLAIIFAIIFIYAGIVLYHWIARMLRPPLIVTETHVQFSGRQYAREQISHFEHQHWKIYGSFAMIFSNGQVLRFPTACIVGTPVREYNAKVKGEIWDVIKTQLFLKIAAAIGAIVILLLFQSAG